MQWSGQQQPNQQHQQQPSDIATHSHSELAHAGRTPNTQPSTAKPVGSPAAATTTSLVYSWQIFEDSPYHFLTSQGPNGS
jgi:hypothetical protein